MCKKHILFSPGHYPPPVKKVFIKSLGMSDLSSETNAKKRKLLSLKQLYNENELIYLFVSVTV